MKTIKPYKGLDNFNELPKAQQRFLVNHKYATYENSEQLAVSITPSKQQDSQTKRDNRRKRRAAKAAIAHQGNLENRGAQEANTSES